MPSRPVCRTLFCLSLIVAACAPSSSVRSESEQEVEFLKEPLPSVRPVGAWSCPMEAVDQSEWKPIQPSGGYVSVNRQLLSIPRGAVAQEKRFKIIEAEADYILVQVGPHGLFNQGRAAVLTLSAARCDSVPNRQLKVVRWNKSTKEWDAVEPSMRVRPLGGEKTEEPAVAVVLDSLSSYALVAP